LQRASYHAVVAIRLAADGPQLIQADTLGAAWLAVAGRILVELAALQRHVAGALALPAGRLLMVVKSAHVYETERDYLRRVLAGTS
jgi:hypothetical protein